MKTIDGENKNEEKNESNNAQNEIRNETENKKISPKDSPYMGYWQRVLLYTSLVLFCFLLATVFLSNAVSTKSEQYITYKESSNLDYKVYLKKNDFYEKDYLDKNMVYVASLIDKIDIDFNYLFDIDRQSKINFDYDITGRLVIKDKNSTNPFFEKEYTLLKNIKEDTNSKQHRINRKISIDYDYYNNLANKFRSDYGIETESNLIVSLNIREKGNNDNKFKLNNNSALTVTIPLSEKAVNIKIDHNDINNSSQIFTDASVVVNNYAFVVISIVCMGLLTVFMFKLVGLLLYMDTTKSLYDKYISKLLKEYDRLIVETPTAPDLTNKNIIKVTSFNELLDVRDNLSLPIKYYIINKHQKCNFYINHNDELYMLVLKAVDFEEGKK